MNSHTFSVRHAVTAFLFLMVGTIGVGTTFAEEKTLDKGPASHGLQNKFSAWRDQLKAQREALRKKHTCNELTFDDIMPAPEDPELWPLWRDWLTQWRKDPCVTRVETVEFVAGEGGRLVTFKLTCPPPPGNDTDCTTEPARQHRVRLSDQFGRSDSGSRQRS